MKAPTKPLPVAEATAQVNIRLTPAGREAIRQLAAAEGLSVQQLGVFAWNLALHAYGRPPLPEND
jgi:predicted DNA binding CopG/RHH family protein